MDRDEPHADRDGEGWDEKRDTRFQGKPGRGPLDPLVKGQQRSQEHRLRLRKEGGCEKDKEREGRTGTEAISRGMEPRVKRAEQEGHPEHVLALGDPGDTLDLDRMNRVEPGRDRGRRGRRVGVAPREDPVQEQEQEDDGKPVQKHVRQVIAEGTALPERVVDRVGEDGEGRPVADDNARGTEHLAEARRVEPLDRAVPHHVHLVVPVRELVIDPAREDEDRRQEQGDRQEDAWKNSHGAGCP